jgi:hypothetical protein
MLTDQTTGRIHQAAARGRQAAEENVKFVGAHKTREVATNDLLKRKILDF